MALVKNSYVNSKLGYIVVLFTVLLAPMRAQNPAFDRVQNLSITDGLGHNGVTSMLMDNKGYLWIGTYDGLNRYDGYEFNILKNTLDNQLFFSNRIRSLHEDNKGNLWIGTDEGINIIDGQSGAISDLYSNRQIGGNRNGPIIRRFETVPDGNTVIGCTEGEGLLLFGSDYEFIGQYLPPGNIAERNTIFFDGTALDNNRMLFATSTGLLLFDLRQGHFFKVHGEELPNCYSIIRVSNRKLLLTLNEGVAIISFEEQQGSYLFKLEDRILETYNFNSSAIDRSGSLWLGTFSDGVIRIADLGKFLNGNEFILETYAGESGLFRASYIYALSGNDCWVATFNAGIYRFDLDNNPFHYYDYHMNYEYGLKSHRVMGMCAMNDSLTYLTVQAGNLALFNTELKQFEKTDASLSASLPAGAGTIFQDSRGDLWTNIGGTGAIYRAIKGDRFKEVEAIKNILELNTFSGGAIAEDKFGNIWIGTRNDIYKLVIDSLGSIWDIQALSSNPVFLNNRYKLVRRIYADPDQDFMWVGSDVDGLLRINIKDNPHLGVTELLQFNSQTEGSSIIPSNFISSIIRLPGGDLWIGTEGAGFCKVINSHASPEFIPYTEDEGLSNNVVKSILYDGDQNLWISTNRGLNKFNIPTETFNSFGIEDGLPFLDFFYAAVRQENGTMVFSGMEGFTCFDPSEISTNDPLPQVHLEELKIYNEDVKSGDTIHNRVLLTESLSGTKDLVLKYNENVFSIKVNSLHYSNTENHYIRYKLLPINDEWLEIPSSQRVIYFNGLQPGDYRLVYAASNALNNWSEDKTLGISITPPFWRTIVAYIVYSLLLILIIYLVIRFVLRMQALGHKLEMEEMEVKNVKEVNEAKLRFFSNISHEFKTPLTLISAPVDYLASQFKENKEFSDKLQIIKRQSRKITQLVEQVHDFQRAEANLLKLNLTRFEVKEFFDDLLPDFYHLAKVDKKTLDIDGVDEEIIVLADRKKFEKIFNNLLSNAFKFTSPGDRISIEYQRKDKNLVVKVNDTGRGISQKHLPHIFERFYQAKRSSNDHTHGSGIGLAFTKRLVEMHYGYISAESEAGVGTAMHLRLPVIRTRRSDDENKLVNEILSAEKDYATEEQLMNDVDPTKIEIGDEFKNANIFLVEDDADMRLFVSEMLSNFFNVTAYANGQECLNALEDEWPDLVVSDVLMPEVNGFELSKLIKSDIRTSHIPIILLTACTAAGDQIQGIMDGADAYIFKPFNVQHLVSSIESLLKNRQQLQERYQAHLPLAMDKKKRNSSDEAFLNKLYTLMEENMDNSELDLDSFARELYLSRSNFYQKVKALTNQTPYEFLKTIRLEKAAHLLVNENLSVNEVYMITGFKSRTHFSKLFKEKYNASPGKFAAETQSKYEKD